jgi:hypothetical protein
VQQLHHHKCSTSAYSHTYGDHNDPWNPRSSRDCGSIWLRMGSETPQHDGVQWWCRLAPTQPFRRPREREKKEIGGGVAHQGGEESSRGLWDCMLHPSPPGAPLYSGEEVPLPLHQGTPRAVAKGRSRAAARVGVGSSQHHLPKTLAPSWLGPWPLAHGAPFPYPIRGCPRV